MPRPHVDPATKKTGRPVEWTEERIDKLVEKFNVWLQTPANHIYIKDFLSQEDMTQDEIDHVKAISKKFARVYKKAKELQEKHIVTNCLNNKYNNTMGIFILKCNHGYKDREVPTHVKQQANSGTDHNVIVNIPGLQEPKE